MKKTGKCHWAGDRKQTTLWHISGKDQDATTVHGTQKPVECMRRPILNNSSPGQAVFEPFMGSGTTLIAAETTGRVCFGIELNPGCHSWPGCAGPANATAPPAGYPILGRPQPRSCFY